MPSSVVPDPPGQEQASALRQMRQPSCNDGLASGGLGTYRHLSLVEIKPVVSGQPREHAVRHAERVDCQHAEHNLPTCRPDGAVLAELAVVPVASVASADRAAKLRSAGLGPKAQHTQPTASGPVSREAVVRGRIGARTLLRLAERVVTE
jgi:hypothetical protein